MSRPLDEQLSELRARLDRLERELDLDEPKEKEQADLDLLNQPGGDA